MEFRQTWDRPLIAELVRRAWDRPEMLSQGARVENIPGPLTAHYFVGVEDGRPVALFVGQQQSPVCIDLHACMSPECRGRKAINALSGFLDWLPTRFPWVKAIGSIPAYNKPMLYVAKKAGFTVLAINEMSTMRNGKLEDQVVMEKRLQ